MTSGTTMEYIQTPRAERRRPTIALTIGVLALVAGALLFAWWSDSVRRATNDRLADVVAASSARVVTGEAVVTGTLAYASPMIWSAAVSEEVRAGLRAVVQDSAAQVAVDLAATRASAADVTVLPWQAAQATAREQVLSLLDTEIARFERIAADATTIGEVLGVDPPSAAAAVESLRASGAEDPPVR
jgi:hypothetical protein